MGIQTKKTEGTGPSPEELLKKCQESACELTEEQMEKISGGGDGTWGGTPCPKCKNTGVLYNPTTKVSRCGKCGHTW